jgi:hypothetical protein
MSVADKAAAVLTAVRREDVNAMSPAARQRLADLCRHVAGMAEPRTVPKSGVLGDLSAGQRAH